MSLSTLCLAHPAEDFPGETFRVLKNKEEKAFGEYRTRRLVLEAWERQEQGERKGANDGTFSDGQHPGGTDRGGNLDPR